MGTVTGDQVCLKHSDHGDDEAADGTPQQEWHDRGWAGHWSCSRSRRR